jgi:perosamine synthetase
VIATVNGTAALHVGLIAAGVGRGDEVLVPALTFVASANAVALTGGTPHFVDCDEGSLGVDAAKLAAHLTKIVVTKDGHRVNRATGRPIKALVVVHVFGHSADLDALEDVCGQYGITLIEDAAEALGTRYKGRHVGARGLFGALSFNGNKIVTTGGGGAIATDDDAFASLARRLASTARVPHRWDYVHDAVAFNYRLPNLNAALGCAQLRSLPRFLAQKRVLADRYAAAFAGIDGARVLREPEFSHSNYWLNALVLDHPDDALRNAILEATNAAGFATRPTWKPLHDLPMYADCPRMDLATAESLRARVVNLPSSARYGA